ncbi:MAG: hypothetical protein KTR15_04600 [Phycisphaeraceae bacterium]|nr:hypothetical protein [Phycisphaeraceae bacterium]
MNNSCFTRVLTATSMLVLLVVPGCRSASTGPAADQAVEKGVEPAINKPAVAVAAQEQPAVPSTKLSGTPGAPMVIEEVQEQSADTPATVPVVDPTVTNPTPTVTDTPIPTTLVGLTYRGGQTGGSIGNTTGDGDFGTDVFGNGGNARNIVYLIDASGSMMKLLPIIEREMNRVVRELKPAQNITILVFSGNGVYEVAGGGGVRGLRSATPEFKEDIADWLKRDNSNYKIGGAGSKHAEEAIRKALSYRPQLVYLLSDKLTGGGQGATQHEIMQGKLMESIRKANDADKPTKFNTIQFLREDPLVRAGLKGTLQLIAEDSGGSYRFIGERDLNLK